MIGSFKFGFLGLRKVVFNFNLAALKAATQAAKMDLGEFFSSPKMTEDHRVFYHSFGAWLNGKEYTPKQLKKYAKMYGEFSVKQLAEIKHLRNVSEIISEEYRISLKQSANITDEKKN